MTALTIPAFLLAIGVLITIHEYGHFQVARWCNVRVLRFSIGFGKALYTKRFGKDQTEFVIAAIPLGGYVKMLDERELEAEAQQNKQNPEASQLPSVAYSEQELSRAFNRQAIWKRMAIVAAGPVANLLLAIFIYWLLFMHGVMGLKPILGEVEPKSPAAIASMKQGEVIQKVAGVAVSSWQDVHWLMLKQVMKSSVVEIEASNGLNELHLHHINLTTISERDLETDFLSKLGLKPYQPVAMPVIGEVLSGSAAEKAGLKQDDKVLQVNQQNIQRWEQLVDVVRQNPGKKMQLNISRAGAAMELSVTPDVYKENGKAFGRIGASYHLEQSELDKLLVNVQYPALEALNKAIDKTWDTSIFSLEMLAKVVTGKMSLKSVSGPLTIADFAGKSANVGWKSYVGFVALISISLGVLNLLPIPVLDGGHLLYYIVEFFKGSPVSDSFMEAGQRIGLSLLGMLMLVAFYNDINRFITG